VKAISRLTRNSIIHRYLDPGEALGEALFGLIMALTFGVGAGLVTAKHELDAHQLIAAAIGCNVAWGVIDATLYVLGSLFYRSQHARFFRALKNARSETEALAERPLRMFAGPCATSSCFLTLILLTPLFRGMPHPALAAIVIGAMLHLSMDAAAQFWGKALGRPVEIYASAWICGVLPR
jgi:hypothetical protein